jgi:hypothetical protein
VLAQRSHYIMPGLLKSRTHGGAASAVIG